MVLESNGDLDWPEGKAKLICDKDYSLIGFNEIVLPPLKKGQHENIIIELNIPSDIPTEVYSIFILLMSTEKIMEKKFY